MPDLGPIHGPDYPSWGCDPGRARKRGFAAAVLLACVLGMAALTGLAALARVVWGW